jgi:dihydrofolate synthase/folylpolyglutamate synthase
VLGNTLEEIAKEKAGIIKAKRPVVIGNISGSARKEIEKVALEKESPLILSENENPGWDSSTVTLNTAEITINTKFKEAINRWNVAMAWKVVQELKEDFPVSTKSFSDSVSSFPGAPGRFEKLHPQYEWYFSGSHNAQALESSIGAVEEMKPRSETVLVFSAMKDKLNTEMLRFLEGFKRAYFVEQEGDRAATYNDIKERIDAELLGEDEKEIIFNELKTELVIFVGSFYFYPIVKRWSTYVS